jgi:ubiquinone/menaquinone biosynthesis C-methylase UbiE
LLSTNYINQSALEDALKHAISNNQARIGHNDSLYLDRIYREGLSKYIERLQAIGFTHREKVLDAGCGYGQWSLALAQLNRLVSACDISPLRITLLSEIVKELGVSNLEICISSIDTLPYGDASFDAVFCYGVIRLTPWRKSLSDFARVLKPGGTLYVNASGLGWCMHLWQDERNKADDYDPKAMAASTLVDTLKYDREGRYESGMSLIIEPKAIEEELLDLGFLNIQTAHEGGLHLDKSKSKPQPFFKGQYLGQLGAYELVANKGE